MERTMSRRSRRDDTPIEHRPRGDFCARPDDRICDLCAGANFRASTDGAPAEDFCVSTDARLRIDPGRSPRTEWMFRDGSMDRQILLTRAQIPPVAFVDD